MPAADLLLVIAPDLACADNADGAVAIAEGQVSPEFPNRDTAVAYMAAHILAMSQRNGAAGAITSQSEGGMSQSYAVAGTSRLDATAYGSEYQRLARLAFGFSARTTCQ